MSVYQRKDRYYKLAKEKGLPSRASFKIEEILKKHSLVKPGDTVLDLGAAPGGWSVILAKAVGPRGKVLAVDLEKLKIVSTLPVHFFQGHVQSEATRHWLKEILGGKKLAALFSDMSPKLTGIAFKDHYESYELGLMALEVAKQHLKAGGHFVSKIFPGEEFPNYLKILRGHFDKVKVFEPESSRKTSREVYVLGMDFQS